MTLLASVLFRNLNDEFRPMTFNPPETAKCRDQIFGEAVGEIQRIGIAAFVDQRQDGYGFFGNDDSDAATAVSRRTMNLSVNSSTTASASTPMIQKSSLRPVARTADRWAGLRSRV